MVERLKKILEKEIGSNKWLINYEQVKSKELFFIKDRMDMNRAKSVEHCRVTVYKEIEDAGQRFLGSSVFKAAPGMSDEEIAECIKDSIYSAGLVKNQVYSLAKPSDSQLPQIESNIDFENGMETIEKTIKLVYGIDGERTASVNSMEIFLQQKSIRVANSEGVDLAYTKPELIIELVVDCEGEKESVELYDMIKVSSFDEEFLKRKIEGDFINVEKRAIAEKVQINKEVPVVLRGAAVCEIFSYYTFKSDTLAVYKKYSQAKIGDEVQGSDIAGDKISITLKPEIKNSVDSAYVDADGVILKELPLIKDGRLLAYHGSSRYSQYCNVDITGEIPNVCIHAGSGNYDEMLKGECIEVFGFSDFQMDAVTGDFGGEIRLAVHHMADGTEKPITGGSVTGNIEDIQKGMILCAESDITGHYQHPRIIKIKGAKISF
ncbi:MAG: hypothetical protein JXN65_10600 [Clostridia bacterium]|nr:hypothetical protein [Clostridia bacterium]